MAASLISRHPSGRLLGIAAGITPNTIVISVLQDGVHVHSLQSEKIVRTYPLGSNNATLVCPVVTDPDSSSYYAGFRDVSKAMDYLVTWDASTVNVPALSEISPRIPVDGRIEGLHNLTTADSSSAVVVLSDGSVAVPRWNDFKLQFLSSKTNKSTFVTASSFQDTLLVVTQQSKGSYACETFTLSPQGVNKAASFSLSAPSEKTNVVSATCNSSTISLLWSTCHTTIYRKPAPHAPFKHALTYHLSPSTSPPDPTSSATTPNRKRKAPTTHPDDAPSPIALHAITPALLLIATSSPGPSSPVTLSFLHTHYGCILSSTTLKLPSPPATPAPFALSLSSTPSLLLSASSHLYHLHLETPQPNLSTMLGKLSMLNPSPSTLVLTADDLTCRAIPPSSILTTAQHLSGITPPTLLHDDPISSDPTFPLHPLSPPTNSEPTANHTHPETTHSKKTPQKSPLNKQHDSAEAAAIAAPTTPTDNQQQLQEHHLRQQQLYDDLHQQQSAASAQAGDILSSMLRQQREAAALEQQHQHAGAPSTSSAAAKEAAWKAEVAMLGQAVEFIAKCTAQQGVVSSQLPQLVAMGLVKHACWPQLQGLLDAMPELSLYECRGLLERLVAARQFALLLRVAARAHDLPPGGVAGALQLLLVPAADEELATAQRQHRAEVCGAAAVCVGWAEQQPGDASLLLGARWAAAVVDGFSAREVCLHLLVAVELDVMEMVAVARQLQSRQVMRLLRYLGKWVEKYNKLGFAGVGPDVRQSELLVGPDSRQVLMWMQSLLDAHLAMLVVQGGQVGSLKEVHDMVQEQVAAARHLLLARGTVEHMLAGGKLPAAAVARATNYTVELLDLRVSGAVQGAAGHGSGGQQGGRRKNQ